MLGSCQKEIDSPEPVGFDNEYFPITIGNWVSYQIQEINIDVVSGVNDTISYQIKEVVESMVENLDEYKSFRLERYFRYNDSEEWTILNIWQIRQYARRIHKIEDNIEYIRLITPVIEHDEWNGNTYNHLDDEECFVKSINDTLINNQNESVAYIVHQDLSSLIDKKFSEEQYAKDIGLIQKTIIDIELNIDPNLPWEQKVTKGTIYYQNYLESKE